MGLIISSVSHLGILLDRISIWTWFLIFWGLIECFLIAYIIQRYVRFTPVNLPEFTEEYVRNLTNELKNPKSTPNPIEFIEGWFLGANINTIGYSNLRNWISDMLFKSKVHKLNHKNCKTVNKLLIEIETFLDFEFKELPDIPVITLSRPISIFHRPLIFYGFSNAVDYSTRGLLRNFGFTRRDNHHLVTYYRKGNSLESPIIFCHGRNYILISRTWNRHLCKIYC